MLLLLLLVLQLPQRLSLICRQPELIVISLRTTTNECICQAHTHTQTAHRHTVGFSVRVKQSRKTKSIQKLCGKLSKSAIFQLYSDIVSHCFTLLKLLKRIYLKATAIFTKESTFLELSTQLACTIKFLFDITIWRAEILLPFLFGNRKLEQLKTFYTCVCLISTTLPIS